MRGRRPSPAVVIAVLALVAALGGTAVAGSLTSEKRKPHRDAKADTRLFKKLLKKAAPKLSVRRAASAGTAATAKTAGSAIRATNSDKLGGSGAGSFQHRVAKPGELQTGIFEASGVGGYATDAVEFDPPLAADLCVGNGFQCDAHVRYITTTPTASCPGVGRAARGVLCLYEGDNLNLELDGFSGDPRSGGGAIRKDGTILSFLVTAPAGQYGFVHGVWAMRAP